MEEELQEKRVKEKRTAINNQIELLQNYLYSLQILDETVTKIDELEIKYQILLE